jgi:hypothetical protein
VVGLWSFHNQYVIQHCRKIANHTDPDFSCNWLLFCMTISLTLSSECICASGISRWYLNQPTIFLFSTYSGFQAFLYALYSGSNVLSIDESARRSILDHSDCPCLKDPPPKHERLSISPQFQRFVRDIFFDRTAIPQGDLKV